MNLTLKFPVAEITSLLGPVQHGDEFALTLEGNLLDGTPIKGTDCVVIRGLNGNQEDSDNQRQGGNPIQSISNHPNPFNASTVITYTLETEGQVQLEIFDVLGRRVTTLVNDHQSAGPHMVTRGGRDEAGNTAASGMYFYRLRSGDNLETRKMLLLK